MGVVGTIAVLVVAAVGFFAAVPKPHVQAGYREYLGPDGIEVVTTIPPAPNGPFTVSQATSGFAEAVAGIPSSLAASGVAKAAAALPADIEFIRSYFAGIAGDGTATTSYAVYALSSGGLLLAAERVAGTDLWYDPPMPVMPANPAPGMSWDGAGGVSGVATYAMTGTIEPATDAACIRTVVRSRIELAGKLARSVAQDTVWCRGRGSVRSEDLDSGVVAQVSDPPVPAPPRGAPLATLAPPEAPGVLPLLAPSVRLPPRVAGGWIAMANATGADVLLAGTAVADASTRIGWQQHPGGAILGLSVDQRGPIVATTKRQVIALDSAGRWRWTTSLPDAVAGTPVVVGQTVVVALLDGTVAGIDCATGAVKWSSRMSDAVVASPALAGDVAVVADIAGQVVAYGGDGVERWTASTGAVLGPISALPDGSVLIIDGDSEAHLLGPEGQPRWTVPLGSDPVGFAAQAGDLVIVPTEEGAAALAVIDGSQAWVAADWAGGQVWSLPSGAGVLVTAEGRAGRVDLVGHTTAVRAVEDPAGGLATGQQLLWLGGRPVAVTSRGSLIPLHDLVGGP